jgi:hypothetical protein
MCELCDAAGQWVCDCGRVVRIGQACVCGSVRGDTYVPCVVVWLDETDFAPFGVNRAGRRRRR